MEITDILVEYVFELRRTCPNYWWFYQHTVTLSGHVQKRGGGITPSPQQKYFFLN